MKTGFATFGVAASAIAALSLLPEVEGHAYLISPPPNWAVPNHKDWYNPLAFLEGSGVQTSDDLPGFMRAHGYATLRDMLDDENLYNVDPGLDWHCGLTTTDTPVPIPDTNSLRLTGYTHDGPCEVWLDDTLVQSGQNCHAEFPGKGQEFDYSACGDGCMLRWYWLGIRYLKNQWSWQVYKNCVLLGNGNTGGRAAAPAPFGQEAQALPAAPAQKAAEPVADVMAQGASNYVIGDAPGYAVGTTGGAGGKEVTPNTIEELKNYLYADEPLVILITKKFDFTGTEGSKTDKVCASHYSVQCPDQAQYVIIDGDIGNTGGCDGDYTQQDFTWDLAGQTALRVKGDKTVRGIGQSGEIVGKGLKVVGDNVIIQNVYIHDINPQFVWGGDAIAIDGGNQKPVSNVWIDHVRIKNIGRQMIVTHYGGARSTTVSNSEFDGTTAYSASCDGRHYWTFLIYGTQTSISLLGNYVHDTSGRSPKAQGNEGQPTYVHVANNYWANSAGVFELSEDAYVLAEGNVFESDEWSDQSKSNFFFATDGADCSALGRDCVANQLSGSSGVQNVNGAAVLSGISSQYSVKNYSPTSPKKLSTGSSFFGVNGVEPSL